MDIIDSMISSSPSQSDYPNRDMKNFKSIKSTSHTTLQVIGMRNVVYINSWILMFNPILLDNFKIKFLVNHLVNSFASHNSHIPRHPFFITSIANCESQQRETWRLRLLHIDTSSKRLLNHSVSYPTNSKIINSDSMVERAIHVWFEDFHYIIPHPK